MHIYNFKACCRVELVARSAVEGCHQPLRAWPDFITRHPSTGFCAEDHSLILAWVWRRSKPHVQRRMLDVHCCLLVLMDPFLFIVLTLFLGGIKHITLCDIYCIGYKRFTCKEKYSRMICHWHRTLCFILGRKIPDMTCAGRTLNKAKCVLAQDSDVRRHILQRTTKAKCRTGCSFHGADIAVLQIRQGHTTVLCFWSLMDSKEHC